jgi:glutaredoxin
VTGPGRPGAEAASPVVTLLGRPGCHLCDDAREVIARVAADLGVRWEERDITASPRDLEEYWDKIPVTLIDGVQHDFWRVSEHRLRAALARAGAPGMDGPGNP